MDKQVIILVALIALVVLAGVQAVQISDVKEIATKGLVVSTNTGQQNVVQSAPASQQPTMVGGC